MRANAKKRAEARIGEDEMELAAWRSISHAARALLLPIRARGRRHTNGRETITIREIKAALACGSIKAAEAFQELFNVGFLIETGRSRGGVITFRRTEQAAPAVGIPQATCDFRAWQKPASDGPARPSQSSTAGVMPSIGPAWPEAAASAEIIDIPRGFLSLRTDAR